MFTKFTTESASWTSHTIAVHHSETLGAARLTTSRSELTIRLFSSLGGSSQNHSGIIAGTLTPEQI